MEKRKQGSVVVTGVEKAILSRVIRESKSLRRWHLSWGPAYNWACFRVSDTVSDLGNSVSGKGKSKSRGLKGIDIWVETWIHVGKIRSFKEKGLQNNICRSKISWKLHGSKHSWPKTRIVEGSIWGLHSQKMRLHEEMVAQILKGAKLWAEYGVVIT